MCSLTFINVKFTDVKKDKIFMCTDYRTNNQTGRQMNQQTGQVVGTISQVPQC